MLEPELERFVHGIGEVHFLFSTFAEVKEQSTHPLARFHANEYAGALIVRIGALAGGGPSYGSFLARGCQLSEGLCCLNLACGRWRAGVA